MVTGPRRVARLITRLNIGGPARQALALTQHLRPEFETVLGAGTPAAAEGELSQPDVHIHRLPLVRPLRPRTDVHALLATRRLIVDHRADLVHTHMAKAGTIGRLSAATVRPQPRTVHTYHGHVLDGYFRPTIERAFLTAERALAHLTDVIVAISPEIRDSLLELGVGTLEQYRVIPLGFDLEAHRAVQGQTGILRERIGLGPDVPLVGVVGRLVPIKDHATLLEAMVRLPDVHLAVLGDGELRAELEATVANRGMQHRVHFVGWWTDIPSAMADMDVVALSSRNEGTPVSLIEAGACARPIVATDVGGVRSVVAADVSGSLVPAGDPVAFADALDRVLADAALGRRFGQSGRERSLAFDQARLLRDIQGLYSELL
jgi:glycosyltransferase involved in cell wall biosynthesis